MNIQWIAGLLEGEGCFSVKSKTHGTILSTIQVQCHMTDEDVIKRLHTISGCGTAHGPYSNGPKKHYKPRFMWRVSGKPAYLLIKELLPHMGERRTAKMEGLLAEYEAFAKAKGKPLACHGDVLIEIMETPHGD